MTQLPKPRVVSDRFNEFSTGSLVGAVATMGTAFVMAAGYVPASEAVYQGSLWGFASALTATSLNLIKNSFNAPAQRSLPLRALGFMMPFAVAGIASVLINQPQLLPAPQASTPQQVVLRA